MAVADFPDNPEDPRKDWLKRYNLLRRCPKGFAESKVDKDPDYKLKTTVIKWFIANATIFTRISVICKLDGDDQTNIIVVQAYDEHNAPRRCYFDLAERNNIEYIPEMYPRNLWEEEGLNHEPLPPTKK